MIYVKFSSIEILFDYQHLFGNKKKKNTRHSIYAAILM